MLIYLIGLAVIVNSSKLVIMDIEHGHEVKKPADQAKTPNILHFDN